MRSLQHCQFVCTSLIARVIRRRCRVHCFQIQMGLARVVFTIAIVRSEERMTNMKVG